MAVAECLAAVLIILLLIVINGYLKKDRQLPGPFPLPLIGGAYVLFGHLTTDRLLYKFEDLTRKYKRTFSILFGNEKVILISKPEHVQVFCTSPHLLDHPTAYDHFNVIIRDGLFTANGASWKAKRKAWAPSFHPSVIRTFVKSFQDLADIFVEKLENEVNGPEFQLHPYIRGYFLDAIYLTHLEFNHNSQREFRKLNGAIEVSTEILYKKMFNIFFCNETIFKLSASGKKFVENKNYVRGYMKYAVEKKTEDFANEAVLDDDDLRKNRFLRKLLGAQNVSKEVVMDEIITLVFSGSDTLTEAMGFIALMLGKHQDVQERVFLEDQEIQKSLNGCELQMDDLPKYEYLDRVIKETLRIFPGAPLFARKAAEDVKMGDITIPKGATVGCFAFALHRDPEIYPNPLEFNPDNFLPEKIAERHPYSYMTFSGGPRNCIGIKFAMTSLKVIVSTLVRNYRLFSNRNVEDIKLASKLVMGDAENFPLRIEKR